MRAFTPSYTDLSYILLTIDPGFNLTVLDPSGSIVDGKTYIDDPLVDDINNTATSGTPIKVFELPKPKWGTYVIEITGNGAYTLNSYLYDKNGRVTKATVGNDLGPDEENTFNIIIGSKNSVAIRLDLKKISNDLSSLHRQKQINNFAYQSVKFSLNTVKNLIKMRRYDLVRKILNLTKEQIRIFTPWAIKTGARDILIEDINVLISSF